MAPGLETSILWATGRLLRRGAETGEQEFAGILKLHTSTEARTTVYEAWIAACQKARLKAEEAGDSRKSREYAEAEQRVRQQSGEQIGASATEKNSQGQQSSQAASGAVPESSGIAASKEHACAQQAKRPYESTAEDATVHSCAVVPHEKRARSEQPNSTVTDATEKPLQGPIASFPATKIDTSVTATPALAHPAVAQDRSHMVAPQSLRPVHQYTPLSQQPAPQHGVHASVTPVTTVAAGQARQQQTASTVAGTGAHHAHSQLSQKSAARDTENSAHSASALADQHPTGGPPSAMHASAADPTGMHHGRHSGTGEPAPTPSAHVAAHSMSKHAAPSTATNAALPPIPSSQGHTRHGSTLSGDGNTRAASAREDGTERSAGMQTNRQGKTARVPLQERPRVEAAAVQQPKVVTFQEPQMKPQSSRDGAENSQRQQHVQRPSPSSSKATVKQHSNSDMPLKETNFSGWDIADPNLCRPKNYKPIRNPKEGDILFIGDAPFKIMYRVGSGASSKVYKVLGPNLRLFALKVVTLRSNSKEMVRGFKEEFAKLKSLKDSPGVINVYSLEEFPEDKMLLMCLEIGEIDLAHLLRKKRAEWAAEGITDPFVADPTFICSLWQQMLRAVQSIHQHKMVHADLKPANLVIANGCIKIIDFGISVSCGANTTSIHRDENTGTVNYMSPEAIANNERVGRNSDVWSLGCILYEIAYGKLPFGHIINLASKVEAIMSGKVEFPPISQGDVLHVLKRCLVRNPDKRADIDELLSHQYLKAVAGGVITHQTMWNMMVAGYKRLNFTEEELNELCRQSQEATNAGQPSTAEAILTKAEQRKKAAILQLEELATQAPQNPAVLQQQQPNRMPPSHNNVQQTKRLHTASGAMQPSAAKIQHQAENAGDVLDARLMAIRRANVEADDGNTRTRM